MGSCRATLANVATSPSRTAAGGYLDRRRSDRHLQLGIVERRILRLRIADTEEVHVGPSRSHGGERRRGSARRQHPGTRHVGEQPRWPGVGRCAPFPAGVQRQHRELAARNERNPCGGGTGRANLASQRLMEPAPHNRQDGVQRLPVRDVSALSGQPSACDCPDVEIAFAGPRPVHLLERVSSLRRVLFDHRLH